jgi:hypothetical protein
MSDTPAKAEKNWEDLVNDYGLTPYNRRLADKILNAYNQAIALDHGDVADLLIQALKASIAHDKDNRNQGALLKADLWQRFVSARNAYRSARDKHDQQAPEVLAALDEMKNAYTAWSEA